MKRMSRAGCKALGDEARAGRRNRLPLSPGAAGRVAARAGIR